MLQRVMDSTENALPDIQSCLKLFRNTDCIMEPQVFDILNSFLSSGGLPETAIAELSSSYVSLAQMVNLLADWMVQLAIPPSKIQNTIENHFYNLVIKYFDPKKADKIFNVEGKVPDWLGGLVENKKWRNIVYELAEDYPDCLMLTFTVKLIAESGFQREITGVATASQQLEVFSGVLNTAISSIANSCTSDPQDHIKELSSIVKYGEHSFLFSHILLSFLAESSYGGAIAERVKQDILLSSAKSQNILDIVVLNFAVTKSPVNPRALRAMTSMLSKNQLNPADIAILYNFYQQENDSKPPVSLLRDPIFLDLTVASLFCTSPKINPDYRSKYVFLLAYSVSVYETWKLTKHDGLYVRLKVFDEDLASTLKALERVMDIMWFKGPGREMLQEIEVIFDCLKVPVVSFGIIKWIADVVADESFHDRTIDPTPIPLLILDEITDLHPLLHHHVFALLKTLFLETFSSLATYTRLDLEKTVVDRMLHLVYNDFVTPVLDFFCLCLKNRVCDTSLVRHFLFQLLDMIGPPYSEAFVSAIEPLCTDDSFAEALISKAAEKYEIKSLMDTILENKA